MMRKAARYCPTLSVMTSQCAITTSTVMKLFRRMSGMEMPSTPRW